MPIEFTKNYRQVIWVQFWVCFGSAVS